MLPSVLPRLTTDSAVRLETSLFLRLHSQDGAPSLPLSSLFLSFIFFPTSFQRQWAALLGAWCLLPAFRSCFVEFTQGLNVLLMNLWGIKWSLHPFPPPSSENIFFIYFSINGHLGCFHAMCIINYVSSAFQFNSPWSQISVLGLQFSLGCLVISRSLRR